LERGDSGDRVPYMQENPRLPHHGRTQNLAVPREYRGTREIALTPEHTKDIGSVKELDPGFATPTFVSPDLLKRHQAGGSRG